MKNKWILWLACFPLFWCASCSDDEKGDEPQPEEQPETVLLMGSETRKLAQVLQAMEPERALDRQGLAVTDSEFDEIKTFTDGLVAGKTGDAAYEEIFQWITANVKFGTPEINDPYDVFVEKVAVCQGYANLLKTMCLTQGIPCVGVNGVMDPDTYYQQGHAWNYVRAGERWIVSDPTNGRDWDMEKDVNVYSNIVEPYFIDVVVAEDDNFVYGYYHGLNVNEVKADADTVVVPDAVLGFYVTSCNPSALSPSVKVLELNERIDYLGDQNSEGLRSGFAGTFLESILVASGNKNFESYEGVLYASGSDLPVIIPGAMRVVHLRSAAFEKNEAVYYHDSVEEIHFAEGTPSIAAAAVEGCPNLKRVYVPASAEVADGAFPTGVEIVRF